MHIIHCSKYADSSKRAFSLVELSIVLVILGLLVGGVLSGQSLIRAAELRTVSRDFARYQTSVYTFRDKYFALPGDITNATRFWGSAGGTGSDSVCYETVSTTAATCNGDGDGLMLNQTLGVGYQYAEGHRAWQQMANAGLIEGSYSGAPVYGTSPGVANPRGRVSNSSYELSSVNAGNFFEYFSTSDYGNTLFFGGIDATGMARAATLKPEEAWNIDTKLDDGKPDTGRLTSSTYIPACYTGTYPNATYALSKSSLQCALRYLLTK